MPTDPDALEAFTTFLGSDQADAATAPEPDLEQPSGPRPDFSQGGSGEPPTRDPGEVFADHIFNPDDAIWRRLA